MPFVFASNESNEMSDVGRYEELSDRDHTFIKHITFKVKRQASE